jgi:hypothetical protein
MQPIDKTITQNGLKPPDAAVFAPEFSYTATAFQNDKYNVTGLSYPQDLIGNKAYGSNKVIFYINVNTDSRVLKQGTNVGVIAEPVQRNRGDLVSQKYTSGQAAAGAAGQGALMGAAGGVVAGASGGTTGRGKVVGAVVKGAVGGVVGAAPGLATTAAIASNKEAPPGETKEPIFSRPQKRLKAAIALYVPNELNIRYSASWAEEDTAEFQAFARGGEELGRALASLAGGDTPRSSGLVGEVLGALALNKGPGGGSLGIASGLAANPKKEQAFKNVDFRTFTFDYRFAPKSQTEAQNVLNIIRALKYHMHPELSKNGFLYIYPSEFDIVYYKGGEENLNIHRHTSCVLTEMNVNYTPNGVFSTFPNGMPTQINVTMTFKELMLLSKELIEKYT